MKNIIIIELTTDFILEVIIYDINILIFWR